MELGDDLTLEALSAVMPDRPIRAYPALVSTEADALAWARSGAPDGAVVAAGYQVSPRGRSGLQWEVRERADLAFSLILRPELPPHREGWVYSMAVSGLADAVGADARIEWPDELSLAGERAGAVGAYVELGPQRTEWAVVNVLRIGARPPRAALLAEIVAAIEAGARRPPAELLEDYRRRCLTLGRRVCARMIPLGPSGPQVVGRAVDLLDDGALSIETSSGRRVAVRPQNLGHLEDPEQEEPSTPEPP